VIGATDKLLDSPAWPRRLGEIRAVTTGGTDLATERGRSLVRIVFCG